MKPAVVLVLTLLIALLVMAPGAQAVTYTFQTFDDPNALVSPGYEGTTAQGINDSGQVSGYYMDTANYHHGFIRSADGSTFTTIDDPSSNNNGSGNTWPGGINNSGQVSGYYAGSSGATTQVYYGFLRSANGSSYTQISDPNASIASGSGTGAFGISNNGQVTGYYKNGTNNTVANGFVMSAGGSFTTINYPNATATKAFGINNSGQVTGQYEDSTTSAWHSFVINSDGSNPVSFDNPNATAGSTSAQGIHDSGQIAGFYYDASGYHGFVRSADGSTYTAIDYPTATATYAYGINNNGQVTGFYTDSLGWHGFIAALSTGQTYSVSGTVTDNTQSPLSGITMKLSGPIYQDTTTASDGTYGFIGLSDSNGHVYTITPSYSHYMFNPPSSSFTVNGANPLPQNFTQVPVVNGVCGSSSGGIFPYPPPTTNLCSAGAPSPIIGSGPWNWSCHGSGGGTTVQCSASYGINGICGSANTGNFLTAPRTNLCSAGRASTVTGTGPWTWNCTGSDGGTTAQCSANLQVNGACGTANTKAFTQAPASNLCTKGTASAVTGSGPWDWTCVGLHNGTTANCSAKLEVIGACGSATANSYTKPTSNFCTSGTPSTVTGAGPWNWTCAGSNGGATARCSAKLEVNGLCGTVSGSNSLTKPASNLCAKGTASTVAGTGPWDWTCVGLNGGTSVGCSANLKVNGACGTANGKSFTTAPSTNLCAKGTNSAVTGSGPWDWTCAGLNTGTTAHCSARLE